ncbi:hypothetical protein [Prosthecochloris sp. HL-130-GSB]|uniref:hypothetical protein n=1 Tax=Prosthecochloris sp. HL-130-GSB TaxID=1974213 RepID=UPI001E2EFAFA|nr:hypothetical protein [Prosthecochloris sp. HL-130-GSB]
MKKPFVLHAVAAVLYGVLVAVLFFPVVFQSMQPASPDSVSPMATALALEKLAMESGTYPLWQPWSFSGMPSVGAFSWLDGLYYPGNILDLFHIDGLMLQLLHLVFAGSGYSCCSGRSIFIQSPHGPPGWLICSPPTWLPCLSTATGAS